MASGLHEFAKKPPVVIGGLSTIAGMAGPNITVTTGTNGTDFAITPNVPSANNLRFDLPIAGVLNTGKLSNTDRIIFNAKMTDPMTTIGDMIYRNGANVTARLPVGANGTFLGVTAGLPVWQVAPTGVSQRAIVNEATGTYTAVMNDFVRATFSTGASTITLPTAVGNAGKKICVAKKNGSLFNTTIDTTAGQTINGFPSVVINNEHTSKVFVSNGTNRDIETL